MIDADGVQTVLVAAGTYYPTHDYNRSAAFLFDKPIAIIGGHHGATWEYNPMENKTILSGDIGNQGVEFDNCFNVVRISANAKVDGFVIRDGYADQTFEVSRRTGAGVYNTASPTVTNCVFTNNKVIGSGSNGIGAAWINFAGDAHSTIINSLFYGNYATGNGGAITAEMGSVTVVNCTFAKNTTVMPGKGTLNQYSSTLTVKNSIVYDNIGAGINADGPSTTNVHHSLVQGIASNDNLDADPLFADANAGDFRILTASPAIDAGDGLAPELASIAVDLAGNPRIHGTIDMGAFENAGIVSCIAPTTWNGTQWSNRAPTSVEYRATIAGDYSSTENLIACQLDVVSGNVTINSGHNVLLKGALNVDGQAAVTFENNAHLIQEDDVPNGGIATYIRNSNPLHYLDYTLWSSPAHGDQTLKQFSPQTLDNRFYVYNTAVDAYSNYTSASGVFGDHPDSVTFAPGKSYLIRMPYGLPQNQTSIFNGVFEGTLNNGTIATPLHTSGNGYNAVGNPYPSPINIWDFIDSNAGQLDDGTLYFWRKTNDATATTYATITKLAYNANQADGGNVGGTFTGDPSEWVLSSGQGFFVKAAAGASGLFFDNQMRRATNHNQFFRSQAPLSQSTAISRFWINITGENSFGQTTIGYTNQTTNGIDYGWDGILVNDGQISVYSLSEGTMLAIQARGAFDLNDIVPLGYKVATAGNYTIDLHHFEGVFESDQTIFLRNNETGELYNLKDSPYVFWSEAGVFDDRFAIVYKESTLNNSIPEVVDDKVVIVQNERIITIKSASMAIENLMIYDLNGKKLYQSERINANEITVQPMPIAPQVLIVSMTMANGKKIHRKILY